MLTRRELLTTTGILAAGNALLKDAVGADQNPAEQVVDRASGIRITALRTFLVSPNLFIRIETNQGVVGWGEIKGLDVRVVPAETVCRASVFVDQRAACLGICVSQWIGGCWRRIFVRRNWAKSSWGGSQAVSLATQ